MLLNYKSWDNWVFLFEWVTRTKCLFFTAICETRNQILADNCSHRWPLRRSAFSLFLPTNGSLRVTLLRREKSFILSLDREFGNYCEQTHLHFLEGVSKSRSNGSNISNCNEAAAKRFFKRIENVFSATLQLMVISASKLSTIQLHKWPRSCALFFSVSYEWLQLQLWLNLASSFIGLLACSKLSDYRRLWPSENVVPGSSIFCVCLWYTSV